MTITYGADRVINGANPDIGLSCLEEWRDTGAVTSSAHSTADGDYLSKTAATAVKDHRLSFGSFLRTESIESLTPGVAEMAGPVARWVADGTATLKIVCEKGTFFRTLAFSSAVGSQYYEFQNHKAATTAKAVSDRVAALLAGVVPAPRVNNFHPQMSIYSNIGQGVRNAGCWANSINFGFRSFNAATAWTLISPDVVIMTRHNEPPAAWYPFTLSFRGASGTIYERQVTTQAIQVGSLDIVAAKLSSSLPADVVPVSFPQSNLTSLFTGLGTDARKLAYVNAIALTSQYKAVPVYLLGVGATGISIMERTLNVSNETFIPQKASNILPQEWEMGPGGVVEGDRQTRTAWWYGDSGSPLLILGSSGPILLGLASTFRAAARVDNAHTAMAAAITTLGGTQFTVQTL
jgi:hypothetical protein